MSKETKSKIYKATVRPIMTQDTRNKDRNLKNQTNVGSKRDENTKENSWQNKNRFNKKPTNQRILAVSNLLMSEWKEEEEENETNM